MSEPITEDWLKSIGFKWSQFDRQPSKHWTLWVGDVAGDDDRVTCSDDLGVEIASGFDDWWHCWLRADYAGRYSRFVHVRHLRSQDDLFTLLAGITGRPFDPTDCLFGRWLKPDQAARLRAEHDRLDRQIMRENPWNDVERDPSIGAAHVDHLVAFEKGRKA